jgi:hypothetical protein
MRRTMLMALLVVTGCQGVVGPFQRPCTPPVLVDDPRLSIPEQEQRGRDRLALPEQSVQVAPRTFAEEPAYRQRPVR